MGRKNIKRDELSSAIESCFSDASIQSKSELCSLWAGYGSIYRVQLSNGLNVIVKSIAPPKSDSVSNQRKLRSYEVEGYFYQHLSAKSQARLPSVYSIEHYEGPRFSFVLENLSSSFPDNAYSMSGKYLDAALDWLANFHASYWNYSNDDHGVGTDGGYWYLATRQEELEAMGNDNLSNKLRTNAKMIDARTRDPQFETLLHGDAKSANMLWKKSGNEITCAWVDFQYVGQGLGARDLAYMLCSSTNRSALKNLDQILHRYFTTFDQTMVKLGRSDHGYTLEKLKEHFEWCLLDYVRFMAGWGFWGNYDWAIATTGHLLT
ncbi:hypothetical protein THRCLA_08627 [Thraustotheca clavata]|uniref:CHK kinase-like domain-containing protein n=1 Tax=Thraustotheca clavata TaxID=74557 RepID=A0A1V9Z3V1_9STRA|nr:hypothetical protein THRCLA_08627 [Thraustotheca clavata]